MLNLEERRKYGRDYYHRNKERDREKLKASWTKQNLKRKQMKGMKDAPLRGKDHPMWKGGQFVHEGYIQQKVFFDHPRKNCNGYVRQHILVWENFYGKFLPPDMVIHHLNGIKNDNRIENLAAMKRSDHNKVVEPYKKRIRQLEAEILMLKQRELNFEGKATLQQHKPQVGAVCSVEN